ncbi:MAG: YceI family protein [Proteobacteria bacterium]|nr:YceI family protein [Pseudomonadota bacterium]
MLIKKTLKFKVIFIICNVLVCCLDASAQTVVQKLDKTSSIVRFSVDSQLMKISGRLLSYVGNLKLDKKTNTPQSVSLKLDASEIHIDPNNNFQTISLDSLFKTIKDPVFSYESTKITQLSKNQYRVEGLLKRGKQTWNSSMTLKSVNVKNNSTECYFKENGPIKGIDREIPFLALGGNQLTGSIESKLVFK